SRRSRRFRSARTVHGTRSGRPPPPTKRSRESSPSPPSSGSRTRGLLRREARHGEGSNSLYSGAGARERRGHGYDTGFGSLLAGLRRGGAWSSIGREMCSQGGTLSEWLKG